MNLSKVRLYVLIRILMLLQSLCANTIAQGIKTARDGEIVSVSVLALTEVQIEIRASNQEIIIPYCQEPGSDTPVLFCNEGLEHGLEYLNGKHWETAKVGYPGEVFGVETNLLKPMTIEPGKSTAFVFRFNPQIFHVHQGEKLRLKINFWSSKESLEHGRSAGTLVSPVFECP